MYRIWDNHGGLTRACTAKAEQALRHHFLMKRAGMRPSITDLRGRALTLNDLQDRASEDHELASSKSKRVVLSLDANNSVLLASR